MYVKRLAHFEEKSKSLMVADDYKTWCDKQWTG